MHIERMTPNNVAPPIGRYSHLVRVDPSAEWFFISGQVGLDLAGVMPGDVYSQTLNVFENIRRLLDSQGLAPNAIVRLLTFLVGPENMNEFARARDEIYSEWFPTGDIPGHSLAMAPALARADVLIEMEGWAAGPGKSGKHDVAQP
ncbi:MAG: RidA family protein [Leucobacter sp.]